MENDHKLLWETFLEKKKAVQQLREALASLHAEKENAFQALSALREQLRQQAVQITTLRQERNALTDEVKSLKAVREKLHKTVREKSTEKDDVEKQWKKLHEDLSKASRPERIAEAIAAIEKKIETEVMPFSQEQQLTKKTKELRQQLRKVQELSVAEQRKNTVTADFAEKRRDAHTYHRQVQDRAQQSQGKHGQMLAQLQQLQQLRADEQSLAEKHLALKVHYHEERKKLGAAFDELRALERLFEKNTALRRQKERAYQEEQLEKKQEEVEEKLKKRQKLTMEDILAFQAKRG